MIYQMKLSWLLITPVMLFTGLILIPRGIPVDDAMLNRYFGKDWDEWAKSKPYRLIPGIL